MTGVDYVAMVNAFMPEAVPSVATLGITCVELEEGRAVNRLPFAGNGNHFGAMYAGSMFVAGEALAGSIMVPSFDFTQAYPLIKNLTINYLRPAKSDVLATATIEIPVIRQMQADVVEHGKASWEHLVELTDADGAVVATMRGEGQVRSWA